MAIQKTLSFLFLGSICAGLSSQLVIEPIQF